MADDFTSDEWADFHALMTRLDPDQAAAVAQIRTRKGNLQCPAAAGSGKTLTIVAAVAALVHDGVQESRIVVTTFTARAGEEMRQRLAQVLGARRAARVRVGTFHSIATKAVRAAQLPILSDSTRNLDGDGARRAVGVPPANLLWSRILSYRDLAELGNRPGLNIDLQSLDLSVSDYALAAGLLRGRGIDYAQTKAVRAAADAVELPQFWKAWSYYEEAKLSLEAFDFADVLAAYRDGLRSKVIHDGADVVIVDETQDNDEVQTDIAALLAGDNPLVVVGDEKQAIYTWRGASPTFFLDFAKRFNAQTAALCHNYRSVPPIVEMGNRVARGKAWSLGTEAVAVRPAPARPCINVLPESETPIAEGARVARHIRVALENGAAPEDFVVLARTNAVLGAYEVGFIRHRVPCVIIGGTGFFTKKETQAVLAYAALIAHDSPTQLEKALEAPKRFLGARFMEEVRAEWTPGQSIVDVIRRVAPRVRGRANALADDIERLRVAGWPTVRDMQADATGEAALEAQATAPDGENPLRGLALIAQILLGPPQDPDNVDADERDPEKDRHAMTWAAIRIAATFESPKALFEFAKLCVANVGTAAGGRGREHSTTPGKVTLSTVFKAKGLEYPHVIVSASAGNFPHARSVKAWNKGKRERIEEEERLFYVAVTRAKDRIDFAWAKTDMFGREAGPSPFLDYVEGECTDFVGDAPVDTPRTPAAAPPAKASSASRSPAPVEAVAQAWTGVQLAAVRAETLAFEARATHAERLRAERQDFAALLTPLGGVDVARGFQLWAPNSVDLTVIWRPVIYVTATFMTARGARPVVDSSFTLPITITWRSALLDLIETTVDNVWRVPTCPTCHAPCAIRSNERGEFWGCMRFPTCRGIARL